MNRTIDQSQLGKGKGVKIQNIHGRTLWMLPNRNDVRKGKGFMGCGMLYQSRAGLLQCKIMNEHGGKSSRHIPRTLLFDNLYAAPLHDEQNLLI